MDGAQSELGSWVSRTFWSTFRNSRTVQEALDELLASLGTGTSTQLPSPTLPSAPLGAGGTGGTGRKGLNIGAGGRRLHPALIAVDIARSPTIDCVADGRRLPFRNLAFELVISQETLEHIVDPFQAVREMERVLKRGGSLYLQTPFVLGYHPDPEDFWRFSHAGVRALIERAGLHCERVEPAFGAGTGLHRILVEFAAGMAALVVGRAYHPAKGIAAIVLYPLKWLDPWLSKGVQRDRIAGGYFGIGKKHG